ncbi:MAG TPA: MtrB/PioB family outer membrane beta-barrel protein, partial [Steroidobacteraceae bacterium]
APAGTVAAYYIPAQPLPPIVANSVDARLSLKYRIRKNQALHLIYEYAQLTDADFGYQGYQLGGASAILPTGQFAPYYRVQVFGLSYIATF